jgi:replicative DNA helicase
MKQQGRELSDLRTASKAPPQSIDTENAVLGSILQNNNCLPKAMEVLTSDCFYDKRNRIIFEMCAGLFTEHEPVDSITLYDALKKTGKIDEAGGLAYINKLATEITSASNIEYHCKIILEKSVLRNLISMSMEIANDCYEQSKDVFEILNDAEKKIIDTSGSIFKNSAMRLQDVYKQIIKHVENMRKNSSNNYSLNTGFYDLDKIIGGLRKKESIILAARPGMGKTALALCIAKNMKVPVGFFSLEMGNLSLGSRSLGIDSDVKPFNILSGNLSNDDILSLMRETHKCSKNIFIDDTAALSPLELKSKAMRMKMEHGIGLIIIDYLQLMQVKGKTDNREREISIISQSIKNLAKDLDIPAIALSQLSRRVEDRQDKKPMLQDLRESGTIEQDADVVMFLYRPEYYDISVDSDGNSTKEMAQVIIAKNRNGAIGECKIKFIKEKTLFENIDNGDRDKQAELEWQNKKHFPEPEELPI